MKPRRLAIKPGLRWTGALIVEGKRGRGWLVQWNAQTAGKADAIYDRCVLTTRQVRDWTGVDLDADGGES